MKCQSDQLWPKTCVFCIQMLCDTNFCWVLPLCSNFDDLERFSRLWLCQCNLYMRNWQQQIAPDALGVCMFIGGWGGLDNFGRNSINVEREAGDVWCLSPVWNLQAVFESPFLSPLSFFYLILLLFLRCHFLFVLLMSILPTSFQKILDIFHEEIGFSVWPLLSS